jgi:hypothetical protein
MTTWRDRLERLSTDSCDKDILDNLRQSEASQAQTASTTSKIVENVLVTRREMEGLATAIAACLSVHAECVEKLGTEFPEQLPAVSSGLRDKIVRQRERVTLSLSGVDPSVHVAHLESLTTGLRLILNRLAPPSPVPAKLPRPVWNNVLKKWEQP